MKRVLIIGNTGSGKTTFAKALAEKSGLPLVHLDRLFWTGNWETVSRDEFDKALQKELEKSEWIIDGNFSRTLPHRLKYCDTVFYFDLPAVSCLWGLTKRVFQNYGKTREDMGGNCPERFDKNKIPLYRGALSFNRRNKEKYLALFSKEREKNIVVFKSRREVKAYIKSLK